MVNVAALISCCLLFFCPAFARGTHRWGVGWVGPPYHMFFFWRGSEEGQWDFLPILVNKGRSSTASLLFCIWVFNAFGNTAQHRAAPQVCHGTLLLGRCDPHWSSDHLPPHFPSFRKPSKNKTNPRGCRSVLKAEPHPQNRRSMGWMDTALGLRNGSALPRSAHSALPKELTGLWAALLSFAPMLSNFTRTKPEPTETFGCGGS